MNLDVFRLAPDQTAALRLFDESPLGEVSPLTQAEREQVRSILLDVAQRLTDRALSIDSMRRRLGAIVESLIEVADALDGDPDLEDGADQEAVCEDEGAQVDDEPLDDNGIADADGLAEQRGTWHLYGGRVVG